MISFHVRDVERLSTRGTDAVLTLIHLTLLLGAECAQVKYFLFPREQVLERVVASLHLIVPHETAKLFTKGVGVVPPVLVLVVEFAIWSVQLV